MRWLIPMGLAGMLGACSMAQSSLIDPPEASGAIGADRSAHVAGASVGSAREWAGSPRCQSDLGAYYLSRSLLKITLDQVAPAEGELSNEATPRSYKQQASNYIPPRSGLFRLKVDAVPIADVGKGYCLDYLAKATAIDLIGVKRTEDALLVEISSLADDQSVKIAQKLIDIVFIGITGNPDYRGVLFGREVTPGTLANYVPKTVLEASYDPTVPMQAALLNERLRDFGHCLILGEHPPQRKLDFAAYCEDPLGYLKRHKLDPATSLVQRPVKTAKVTDGIFYRPRRPYSYYILRKENAKIADSWRLAHTATVNLENDSPILVAAVDRTLFAKRQTKLTFKMGALQHISLDKSSELLGFVDVPLYLAESLVAVPAAIVRVDIDQTVAETNLLGAELQLIDMRNQQRAVEKKIRDQQVKNITGGG